MKKYALIKYLLLILSVSMVFSSCGKNGTEKNTEKIDFILDWVPNTNHTGLYVADKLGYFRDENIEVSIKQPPEGDASTIVSSGKAPFGISFQDSLAVAFSKETPINVTAIGAILQHNTSGIISRKQSGITRPSELENKKCSVWDGPVEVPMIKHVVERDKGNFEKVDIIPNSSYDVVSALNSEIDAMWIYYGWDGIVSELKGIKTNFISFKDLDPMLDYYTPVIVANNEYINNNPDIVKKFLKGLCRGYEYCINHPNEAAMILLEEVPELDENITIESQRWISKQYKAESEIWGKIEAQRWNNFFSWSYNNSIIDKKIEDNFGFTNDYLPIGDN